MTVTKKKIKKLFYVWNKLDMIPFKKDNKSAKFETLDLFFVFLLAQACERNFIRTHSFESRCVIGPENILIAGASVHLSTRKLYRLRQ